MDADREQGEKPDRSRSFDNTNFKRRSAQRRALGYAYLECTTKFSNLANATGMAIYVRPTRYSSDFGPVPGFSSTTLGTTAVAILAVASQLRGKASRR